MITQVFPKSTLLILSAVVLSISACAPSNAIQDYGSENTVSFRYSAWDSVPTLTAEARDKAAAHCAKYGKHANYKGGNAVNLYTSEEIHTFSCDAVKIDDGNVIAGQSQRPDSTVIMMQSF